MLRRRLREHSRPAAESPAGSRDATGNRTAHARVRDRFYDPPVTST
jgi:hypothetical protein